MRKGSWGLLALLAVGTYVLGLGGAVTYYNSEMNDPLMDVIHSDDLTTYDPAAPLFNAGLLDSIDVGYLQFYSYLFPRVDPVPDEEYGKITVVFETAGLSTEELHIRLNQTDDLGGEDVLVADLLEDVWIGNVTTVRAGEPDVTVPITVLNLNEGEFIFTGEFLTLNNDPGEGEVRNTTIYGIVYRTSKSPDHLYEADYITPSRFPLVTTEGESGGGWGWWVVGLIGGGAALGFGLRKYYDPAPEICESSPEAERCRFYLPPRPVPSFIVQSPALNIYKNKFFNR